MDLKLETRSRNYNEDVEEFKKINSFTLRSHLVESRTSTAVGVIQDGKLLLAPLDYCLQMRPNLAHLNVGNDPKSGKRGKRGAGAEDDDDEEDDEPKMRAVEVQVQKRETERQQQQRLNSYAYLSQKEDEEAWVDLTLHDSSSNAALKTWERFLAPKDVEVPGVMARDTYLRAFVPSSAQATASLEDPVGGSLAGAGAGADSADTETISDEAKVALPTALKALFAKHSVCNMGNVRHWLQDSRNNAGAAKEAAMLTDRALHELVMVPDNGISCIRRMYVLQRTGKPELDPFRKVIIDVLTEKDSFKRSEVTELAGAQGIVVTDTLYGKVVKDMCTSRGQAWSLKNGADM